MISQSIYGCPVANSKTIEVSQETLRSILSQIESDLHASEVYQRTQAGLEKLLGATAESAQMLIKAVGQEAIHLALGQFVKHAKVVADAVQETPTDKDEQQPAAARSLIQDDASHQAALETNSFPFGHQNNPESNHRVTAPSYSVIAAIPSIQNSTPPTFTKPNKKLTKAEQAAQIAKQERQEMLFRIGQELRQTRLNRSLTTRQLYTRTLVPVHQIEALEAGCIEALPEDVYLRGFIHRIAHALDLDGVALVASLPTPDPTKSVVPSWHHSKSAVGLLPGGFHLSPVHLYFGYAALVAGAVGGLASISQQSTAGEPIDLNPALSSPPSVSPSNPSAELIDKPGLKSSKTGVKAGPDIAPPEAFKGMQLHH